MEAIRAEQLVARFRQFLLWLSIAMCLGIVAELFLTEHYTEPLQWIPITLCAVAILPILAVLFRPGPQTIWLLRGLMIVIALAGVLGMYEHVVGNLLFAQEVNAAKANAAPLQTMLTGANPALAPGALGITALVALAATYWHPALNRQQR
jgi:hypothetical protein